ncbi:hypothetical protein SARC_03869 [Sphaeroforma arctica JP610]|uniref:Carbamoyl phosphate synthase arginine-specific large chain n=1 Tax=Sphaeroforma arctica JP610 TaxID=667725 RepID=A0A0L0G4C5_9EUKA|nr:hypothetical protein SARC_03869 [Sphaeroforma arctica JP610]KNC83910.1 hypothetical protein SARC_03869 [Sphaeroforma arctica JP610]|eukprot:XP_014157812.1 hypothetical protein SARC_03869 [Sphaeroforma arctica JP610]
MSLLLPRGSSSARCVAKAANRQFSTHNLSNNYIRTSLLINTGQKYGSCISPPKGLKPSQTQNKYTATKVHQRASSSKVVTGPSGPVPVRTPAAIELADGTRLVGKSFGSGANVNGEVVFTTAMVGYPESMTDPSYRGQILVFTQPLIGNYGVPDMRIVDKFGLPVHFESDKIHVAGVVVSNYSEKFSHWTAVKSLEAWMQEHNVPGITGVDTRYLTKLCRDQGTLPGRLIQLSPEDSHTIVKNGTEEVPAIVNASLTNYIAEVSRQDVKVFNPEGDVSVLAVDCGIKNNIIRQLCLQGAKVTVVPWDYDFLTARAKNVIDYDAIFLSNGPGDPASAGLLVERVRQEILKDNPIPIYGICMGNQVMARAIGADTYKMKYGNRSHNQPVINPLTNHCMITSQNHGYAVDDSNLPANWHPHYVNINDGTNEGIFHDSKPFASVQFHPESMGGPNDSVFLFKEFVEDVRAVKSQQMFEWMNRAKPYLYRKRASGSALPPNSGHVHKTGVKTVVVLGSGGLQIGQAGEFDYSGSQAIKALKEEGIRTILINPNIATIQTDPNLSDTTYFLPITPSVVEHVMKEEKATGMMLQFGGQTALNVGVEMFKAGAFARHSVEVLGTPVETLIKSEDRDLFAKALFEINQPVAVSDAVESVEEALKVAERISYPVIIRSAYALGGLGSGFADNAEELRELATSSLSLVPQILVERSMKGWKEIEYEVVRDAMDNCVTVCNMENFDPLGVHTGDSIVVAPSQTLTDKEYHMLRTAAINIVRHMGVVGECNVQYAMNPLTSEYCVIEMNARLSRSSALASKATGYPLAFIAAKLALGYTLPEIKNSVNQTTSACFEPSLDYVVTKIPRWDLRKFTNVSNDIGSCMKSVGEVMAIGRTFEESFQKALRMVDPGNVGFDSVARTYENGLEHTLQFPTDQRVFALADAMHNHKYDVDTLHSITQIDPWFLHKCQHIVDCKSDMNGHTLETLPTEELKRAKQLGFSDIQIGNVVNSDEMSVRAKRKASGIIPKVKQIDTLAGEFPAETNYLYTTYNATHDDVTFDDAKGEGGVMVLGSGVYRIGSSVEFDWCAVSATRQLKKLGHKTIMLNYNPETVSTDYDECDRLYFEELSTERVLDVYDLENSKGIITCVGGQIPQNISEKLYDNGATMLGTHPHMVDMAENRYKFSNLLDSLDVDQPSWKELSSIEEAEKFCDSVGYPCLIRPSYVLSGAAMNVARSQEELDNFLNMASDVSPDHPVVITKFMQDAKEIDIDAVAVEGRVLLHAVSEHIEQAGTHSGDASLVLPPHTVGDEPMMERLKVITQKVAAGLRITGPFNMQILHNEDANGDITLKVIECNLRASRSFPFVSKVLGQNFIDTAVEAIMQAPSSSKARTDAQLVASGHTKPFPVVPVDYDIMAEKRDYYGVKVAQFSFTRLAGADPKLGVEMSSTGEVATFSKTPTAAYLKAIQSVHGFKLPDIVDGEQAPTVAVLTDDLSKESQVQKVQKDLATLGFQINHLEVAAISDSVVLQNAISSMKANRPCTLIDMTGHAKQPDSSAPAYKIRRTAVDFGVPMIYDSNCAEMYVDALREQADIYQTSHTHTRADNDTAREALFGEEYLARDSYINKHQEAQAGLNESPTSCGQSSESQFSARATKSTQVASA